MALRPYILFALLSVHQLCTAQTNGSTREQPEQAPAKSSLLEKCLADPKNIYSPERNVCVAQEVDRKDHQIKKIIDRKLKWILSSKNDTGASPELQKEQARSLRASQKDWRRYRESWCQHVSDMIVGTGSPGTYVYCKLEFSEKRIAELIAIDG